jgi:hypothetical protein
MLFTRKAVAPKAIASIATAPTSWLSRATAKQSRSMLGAMLLIFTLFFGPQAQAEPAAASQTLLVAKLDFQLLQVYFQSGRAAAASGNAAQARSLFTAAYSSSILLGIDVARLQQQNQDTLNRGLFLNRDAQQLAVQLSAVLSVQTQVLSAQLALLSQSPLSQNAQLSAYASIFQVSITLLQLEQAMIRAQQ